MVKDMEQLKVSDTTGRNMTMQQLVKNSLTISYKLNVYLSYDSAIPFLDIYPKEIKAYTRTKVQSSFNYDSPKLQTIQASVNV